ncbi:FAD-dependent oxidoreductase [Sphingobacterium sp. SGR-19]|uniref:FAD-dependent oxidoreductase n=1 Tax=Sphingobacterium sp. SGR-19 TaxID=2710886 RepID=UPI0013EAF7C5|nr:FAD-dependent oxidoreductase [Sphingobacterium sp. SGR-19]NGM64625.1 FAD-dependent oxidoreductase [Sphingobacterium sp. SGR-19]
MKYLISTIFLLLFVIVQPCFGQKAKKPQVIVYGSDLLAFSVAVQSAKSDVPTMWLIEGEQLLPGFSTEEVQIETMPHTDGGIWMELLMEMALAKSPDDSLAKVVKREMNPRLFQNAIEKVLRKLPQLTVLRGEDVLSIKRRKRDWEVQLSSKHRYVVRCVVDASQNQKLSGLVDITWPDDTEPMQPLRALSLAQVRTLVAAGQIGEALYGARLANILEGEKDGFFNFRGISALLDENIALSPFRAAVGQAVGATAAYLAFFKTSVDKVDVRKLQTELMTYGARILPYQDIAIDDAHFYALQRFGLASVLPNLHKDDGFRFQKDERVSFDEVEPIFDRLYSRSQLWFLDNKGDDFQWKDFLSLIKFVGLRGDEVDQQIAKEWSSKLRFEGGFDEEAFVSRYQFAVIMDRYANPYVKAVDQQGDFIN